MKPTSLLFFSSSPIALPLFEALLTDERFKVVGLICQPDKPAGRGKELTSPATKELALMKGVPVFQPEKLSRDFDLLKKFQSSRPDFLLTFAYGQLLSKDWLELPLFEPLNVHPSLLPLYRGPSPLEAALLHGDTKTGITLMRMVEAMDAGPIAFQKSFPLSSGITGGQLYEEVARHAKDWIPDAVAKLKESEFSWQEQTEKGVVLCSKINKEEAFEDFHRTGEEVFHRYQAFTPWPGLWTRFKEKRLKLLKLNSSAKKLSPGQVLVEEGKIWIGTTTSAVQILSLQMEGKSALSASDFLRGTPDFKTSTLPS